MKNFGKDSKMRRLFEKGSPDSYREGKGEKLRMGEREILDVRFINEALS
jgi:hypothetical protein